MCRCAVCVGICSFKKEPHYCAAFNGLKESELASCFKSLRIPEMDEVQITVKKDIGMILIN